MPQTILDAFSAEYGVKITYLTYESQDQAAADLKAGKVYDVVVMGSHLIPELVSDDLLVEIDYRNAPNFKNISANFRDLSYDPGNRYSIPYVWGTQGLLVRTDLVKKPITHWADLWDPEFKGKVVLWPIQTSLVPITLKSLGYPTNSENPQELEAAFQRMLALKQNAFFVSNQETTIIPVLESGQAVLAYGWAYDALTAQGSKTPIEYILPQDGTVLWAENYIIPANTPHKYTAELFLDFVLRPEISAQIANETLYAVPNDPAIPLMQPEVRHNPLIFPPAEALKNAEIVLPLSQAGQKRWDELWQRLITEEQ
jgi:spermidine/putrescine transport system substrate-binding protein